MEILRLNETHLCTRRFAYSAMWLMLLLPIFVSCTSTSQPSHYTVRLTSPIQERECGIIPKIKHRSHTNGIVSRFGQSPWQAGIFDAHDGLFLCSGSLISSRHVITSAACLLAIDSPSSLEVRLGDWDISLQDSPYETYDHFSTSVNKVIINSESSDLQPKIAILILQNHVDYMGYPHIAPVCLPPALPPYKNVRQPYHKCIATGWGAANSLISDSPEDNYSSEASEEPGHTDHTFPNHLQAVDTVYFNPALTAQPVAPASQNFDGASAKNPGRKYETNIIVPAVFATANGSPRNNTSDGQGRGLGTHEIQSGVGGNTRPYSPSHNKPRGIDPVEEYMDVPEYVLAGDNGDSLSAHDSDEGAVENIPVEATTHKRITLSDMPKGDESFEIMESKRHDVVTPVDYSSAFASTAENLKYDIVSKTTTEATGEESSSIPAYESRLYRHKQKYKQGRMASRNKQALERNRTRYLGTAETKSDAHSVNKRSAPTLSRQDFVKYTADTTKVFHSHVNFSSVLKTVDVVFNTKCKNLRSTTPEIISVSNYEKHLRRSDLRNSKNQNEISCIRPKNDKLVHNFCMIDIGSPIACASVRGASPRSLKRNKRVAGTTRQLFKTYNHISRHVYPTKVRKNSIPEQEKFELEAEETKLYRIPEKLSKMYLTGVVTWKDSCLDENWDNAVSDFGATEVANIQELLPFILETLQQ